MEPIASMAACYADLTVAGSDSRKTAWRVLAAIALSRLDASREHTSRSRWTTRHCQPAPGRHAAMARTSPTWASLTTKRTLESLRSRSARRNPSQPAWVSVSTAATPIMRCAPSDPTPIVVVTADDYTRPSLQHLT